LSTERYFFVHIMKTAGTSLHEMIACDVFAPQEMYPNNRDANRFDAYTRFDYMHALSEKRKRDVKFFSAHAPFAAKKVFGSDLRTIAFLRDPVARAISMLRHVKQRVPGYSQFALPVLYSKPRVSASFIRNFQTRVFAMDPMPSRGTVMTPYAVDPWRFELALRNLEKVDFIGIVEDFETSVRMLETFTGWSFSAIRHLNHAQKFVVPEGLAECIRRGNQQEIAFYEHAKGIYEERKKAWLESTPDRPTGQIAHVRVDTRPVGA